MLDLICKELNNWFDVKRRYGVFTISNGAIEGYSLPEGQYFRIVGSVFNDGVYKFPTTDLKDEVFASGSVWDLAIPKELVELSTEIDAWVAENDKVLNSPLQSESFGGYSYTKATNSKGGAITWKDNFADQLNTWRKARCRY